jgi:hypothetical protein
MMNLEPLLRELIEWGFEMRSCGLPLNGCDFNQEDPTS